MSIKNKVFGPPPEDDMPYEKDTECWGCGELFDGTELLLPDSVCDRCLKILRKPPWP